MRLKSNLKEGGSGAPDRNPNLPWDFSKGCYSPFSFETKTAPASYLIKKAIGLESGSPEPHKEKVASITKSQLETIAETKMKDLNANDLEAAVKIIAGTARSMGVTVEN